MVEHTPVPWEVDEAEDLPLAVIADTADGEAICEIGKDGSRKADSCAEWHANAAFIVRACNAHDDLLEVLGAIHACWGVGYKDTRRLVDALRPLIEVDARAAIAKAKGE